MSKGDHEPLTLKSKLTFFILPWMTAAASVNPCLQRRQCYTKPWYSQLSLFYFLLYTLNIVRHISAKDWGQKSYVCQRCFLGRQCQINHTLAQTCACASCELDPATSTTWVQLSSVHKFSVQVQFGVIQCISNFLWPCTCCISETAICRAKRTKVWTSWVNI